MANGFTKDNVHLAHFKAEINKASNRYVRAVKAKDSMKGAKYQEEIDYLSQQWDKLNGHGVPPVERVLGQEPTKGETQQMQNNNCDGSGPHTEGTVKLLRSGGDSNLILCRACWEHEVDWRRRRNLELDASFRWDLPEWSTGEIYGE
jgi:hypothetical protein